MNGYDFDKTIYKTDSSTDFFIFMIFTRPYLLVFIPWFLILFLLYGLKILKKKKLKELLFFFVPWHKNIDKIVNKFWAHKANGIKDWYVKQKKDDDIIISASLGFIIKPVMEMLNIKNWIATDYNVKNGKISGENCYGEQKVVEYKKMFGEKQLESFYSDSYSDLPMMKMSKHGMLVNGDHIKEIDINK